MTSLAIVLPCFNEEDVLHETARRLLSLLKPMMQSGELENSSRILFVDDGSSDNTWNKILALSNAEKHISGIKLASNVGHQNALFAGLMSSSGDVIISLDVDLQDDIEVIKEMLAHHHQKKSDIVYGVRKSRNKDTVFKKFTAELFYKTLRLLGVNIVFNHADYRLMSRRAVEALREFSEVNLFLRGIIPLLGYRSSIVYYDRTERFAGDSKYPLSKMLSLALKGITSFSVAPLRIITGIGFLTFFGTLMMSAWIFFGALVSGLTVPGWASTVLPIYFIGGIQVMATGVLGEYIGRIYTEVKNRPRYIVEQTLD